MVTRSARRDERQRHSNVAALLVVVEEAFLSHSTRRDARAKSADQTTPPVALSGAAYWDLFRERLNAVYGDLQGF
jgi:hypothetical protein